MSAQEQLTDRIVHLSVTLEDLLEGNENITVEELSSAAILPATVNKKTLKEYAKNWRKVRGTLATTDPNANGFRFSEKGLRKIVENFEKTKNIPHYNQVFVNHSYDDVNAKLGRVTSLWVEKTKTGAALKFTALVDRRHPIGERIELFPSVSGTFLLGRPRYDNGQPVYDEGALVELSFVTIPSYGEKSTVEEVVSMSASLAQAVGMSPPLVQEEEQKEEQREEQKDEQKENEGEAKKEVKEEAEKEVEKKAKVEEEKKEEKTVEKEVKKEEKIEENEGEIDDAVAAKLLEIVDRINALEEKLLG